MTIVATKPAASPTERSELVPFYFDTERIVTPQDNPVYTPAMLADILESVRQRSQLMPGWICPSPDLPDNKRLCLEGNRRLAVARILGRQFWAFDLGRPVPEEERIELLFQHNHSRRVMTREEISERAARYMEITSCSAADAAKLLHVSPPTLSRAFGERRILPELRERADQLSLSIRSLIAAVPGPLMARAVEFAETPGTDGKRPTRDRVSQFIQQLKTAGKSKAKRGKTVTLRLNGRAVTIAVGDQDSAECVADDLKAIAAKLGKLSGVGPDGWPFVIH